MDGVKALSLLLGVFLIALTATRVTLNTVLILSPEIPGQKIFYGDSWPIPVQVFDGFFRPLVGAVSFAPFFFRCKNSDLHCYIHLTCFMTSSFSFALELFAFFPETQQEAQELFEYSTGAPKLLRVSRFGLAAVTMQKLWTLGWNCTGPACLVVWVFWLVIYLATATKDRSTLTTVLVFLSRGLIAAVNAAVLLYEAHVKQRLLNKKVNKKLIKTASRGVLFLRLGALLTILDMMYMSLVDIFGNKIHLIPSLFLTVDNCLVLTSILILSGLVGPRDTLDQEAVMAELQYMGRTQGKRIAFPGKLNSHSQDCIVSFPGKYSEEWDAAVRMVEVRSGACSLACVFLTDQDSGLGVHEENPEEPGECWCKALYGQVSAATYISIVEDPGAMSAERLRFTESDAAAMGQVFLARGAQTDKQWAEDKEAAVTAAKRKCEENCGSAPWGCRWFHDWKANVEHAVALGQALHVFYFEGRVGCGKLPWQELSNETSVKEARENGGLGASQTAEVAYLERRGYQFEEHDVAEFYDFMMSHQIDR